MGRPSSERYVATPRKNFCTTTLLSKIDHWSMDIMMHRLRISNLKIDHKLILRRLNHQELASIYTKIVARPGSDLIYTKIAVRPGSDVIYTKIAVRPGSDFIYTNISAWPGSNSLFTKSFTRTSMKH